MQQHKCSYLALSTMLLLLIAKAECNSATLRCYVCDDCANIKPNTELLACNEDYFSAVGGAMPTNMSTESDGHLQPATTTTEAADEMVVSTVKQMNATAMNATSMVGSANITTTTSTTRRAPAQNPQLMNSWTPTNVETTTENAPASSPQLIDTVKSWLQPVTASNRTRYEVANDDNDYSNIRNRNYNRNSDNKNNSDNRNDNNDDDDNDNAEDEDNVSGSNASHMRPRQRRHVMPNGSDSNDVMKYQCFNVQYVSNNTLRTQRGCARVTAVETVCGQLKEHMGGAMPLNKCQQCSTDACNGSSGRLHVSITAAFVVLLAALLKSD